MDLGIDIGRDMGICMVIGSPANPDLDMCINVGMDMGTGSPADPDMDVGIDMACTQIRPWLGLWPGPWL